MCYVCNAKNNTAKNILGFDKISFVDGEGSGVFDNEIADTLGISEVNARVKMNRIKGKLKKILNPLGT